MDRDDFKRFHWTQPRTDATDCFGWATGGFGPGSGLPRYWQGLEGQLSAGWDHEEDINKLPVRSCGDDAPSRECVIAVYGNSNKPTHVARRGCGDWWVSALGSGCPIWLAAHPLDIFSATGEYGSVSCFYVKK